ncbi:MAG: hypothetical protein HETSPECPRED_004969 [Heterodermia speciosa]|uniref:Cytochrome P450 n=1 Tax=Heterodermia speciosa TaxID=116794 RepID=A0A8H3I307_9LECA|nr:MAG: hypothetical protein HETSPECPRED_004969 [Heterodermia speciosa]
METTFTASAGILGLITALTLLVLYITVQRANRKRAETLFEASHGCGAPRRLHYKWPLALDLVVEAFSNIERKQALQWFVAICERTGPTFEQNILGVRGINTIEPRNIESIMSTNFAKHLVTCIQVDHFTDLQPLFFQFTFDTTTFLLFGKSMSSLQATPTQDAVIARETEFSEAFRVSQHYLFRRGRLGDSYWLIGGKDFRKQCSTVHRFIDAAVQEALSVKRQQNQAEYAHSFLDDLIQETRNPKVLRDQLVNMMLAGRDTTACWLTWTFRLLAQHPHVWAKLRKEINSIAGVGEDSRLPDRNMLKRMKYLGLVLKEVLRLYPSVPINSRTALKTTTIPTGGGPDGTKPLMIRKGEAVGYSVYVMHRMKKLYGEDADVFRPERWDPDVENAVDLKKIGWGYLPFGGGPRVCLGQDFALLEAGYVTVRILQKFRSFEMDPSCQDIGMGAENQDVTIVVASSDGCRVKALQ